jgi:hypothetical protein
MGEAGTNLRFQESPLDSSAVELSVAFVVFAGQSNTGGTFMNPSTLPAPWVADAQTLIWNAGAKAWQQMQPGVNTGFGNMADAWGPELQFALDFRAAYPGEVLRIVKHAEGGTGLAADWGEWHYDWSPQSPNELFDRTAEMIADAGRAAGGIKPDALFFGQGEEDGAHAGSAQAYGVNLPAFFEAARAEWLGDPAGKIGFFQIAQTQGTAAQVREAQARTDQADPNAASFDTAGYAMQSDSVHYAAAGYSRIGAEYFDLFAGWRGATPGNTGTIQTTAGNDVVNAGSGNDTILGGLGDDLINDAGGSNYLRGNEGDDVLTGGWGFDDVHGNAGSDTVAGGGGDDWVVGGQGNDRQFGGAGHDVVFGNMGSDVLFGDEGNDVIRGGQDNDDLSGGDGDDWLSGDRGADTLTGGAGADTFNSFGDAGVDRITDFNVGQGDRMRLDAGSTYSVSQVGADTVVSVTGGGQAILAGAQLSSLGSGWIFVGA